MTVIACYCRLTSSSYCGLQRVLHIHSSEGCRSGYIILNRGHFIIDLKGVWQG